MLKPVGLLGAALLVACGGSASSRDHGPAAADGGSGDTASPSDAGTTARGGQAAGGTVARGGSAGGTGLAGTPGSALGGAGADGGTGNGGSAGAAEPSVPLPRGCEARARTATDTNCSLAAYCSVQQSQLTACQRQPSGAWRCQCDRRQDRTFEVRGVEGLEACAVAVGTCDVDESSLEDETCVPNSNHSSDDACGVGLTCSREIAVDFAPNARAWLVRDGWAECTRNAPEQPFECSCLYGGAAPEYQVFADDGASVCRPLVDFCMSGTEPDFNGEERCVLTDSTAGSEGCEHTEGCSNVLSLADGVDLASLAPHYASCTPAAGGGAECYCSTRDSSLMTVQVKDAADELTCGYVLDFCAKDAEIVPNGEPTCEAQSQTGFGTSCEADLTCQQAATMNARAVLAEGRLLVTCARTEPGLPWHCSCASDQTTAKFQLGVPDATAWEACTQAPQACLERLPLHLGPYGEFLYPPDPLSL